MSGVSIHVEDAGLQAELNRLKAAVADLSPAMEQIGAGWRSFVDLEFRSESDPWGVAWTALAESTLRQRRGKGKGAKILRDTGILANSMTYTVTPSSLVLGTAVPYASYHQFAKRIPQRAFLPMHTPSAVDLPDQWRDFALQVIGLHIARAK